MEEPDIFKPEDTEKIELTKNAKGSYQWSIKLKSENLSESDIERIEKLNKQLEQKFGR